MALCNRKAVKLLTCKDECDKTEYEAKEPERDTGKNYLRYERMHGVFGVWLSIASHMRKNYLPSVGILYHVDNTCWC